MRQEQQKRVKPLNEERGGRHVKRQQEAVARRRQDEDMKRKLRNFDFDRFDY